MLDGDQTALECRPKFVAKNFSFRELALVYTPEKNWANGILFLSTWRHGGTCTPQTTDPFKTRFRRFTAPHDPPQRIHRPTPSAAAAGYGGGA